MKIDTRKLSCIILAAGTAIFIAGLITAIFIYPGKDGEPGGYSFANNFISGLGRTKTREGMLNPTGSLIFNISLAIASLSMIPFWFYRAQKLTAGRKVKFAAAACLTYFSLGIQGVALTPYNLHAKLHDFAVHSALVMAIPGIIIFIVFSHKEVSGKLYKRCWALTATVVFSLDALVVILMKIKYLPFRPTNPILQKVNVSLCLLWICCELFLYWKSLQAQKATEALICEESA